MDDDLSEAAGSSAPVIRAADLAGIELRHAVPGRIRLRIPAIKGEPGLSREVQRQLSALPVIRRAEVNPVTATVLVLYDPADSAAIAQLGRLIIPGLDFDAMDGPGELAGKAGDEAVSPADMVAAIGRQLNQRIESATGGALDLKFLVPASLLIGGLVRLMAAKKVPSPTWYDFLWFAFGTYFTLNQGRGPEGAPGAAPVSREKAERRKAAGSPRTEDVNGNDAHH